MSTVLAKTTAHQITVKIVTYIGRLIRQHKVLCLIVAMFLSLCMAYNFSMPIFEGIDEGPHYIAVDYLATNHTFANLNTYPFGVSQEVTQPPLYYVLGAPLISWIERSDFKDFYHLNPGRSVLAYDHTTAEFSFPPKGTVLAVHILRLYSSLFGVTALVLVYAATKMVFEREYVALLTVVISAFNPEFIHRSSIITNDIAVLCTGAATLTLTVALLRRTAPLSKWSILLWGSCFGLSFLSKLNAISLLLLIGCAILWMSARQEIPALRDPTTRKHAFERTLRTVLTWAMLFIVGFLVTAGWYLAYNILRYGDPLLLVQLNRAHAGNIRPEPQAVSDVMRSIPNLLNTYWVSFGYGQIPPAPITLSFTALTFLALVGLGLNAIRGRLPRQLIWLVIAFIGAFLAWLPWLIYIAGGDHARFLDPAYLPIQIMLGVGLSAWITTRLERVAIILVWSIGCAMAVSIIPTTIIPMYAFKPFRLPDEQVRQLPASGQVRFDNHLEIVYVSLKSNRINSGESVQITFYWRAYDLIEKMNLLVIEAVDERGNQIARQVVQPMGAYDTSSWGMGSVMSETVSLPLTVRSQAVASIFAGWFNYDPPNKVAHVVSQDSVSARIATVKVRGQRPPDIAPSHRISVTFGDIASFEGFDILADSIRLYWRSQGQPTRYYTNFVHVLGSNGEILWQSDTAFRYPSTMWDVGEQIIEDHSLPGIDMSKVNNIIVGIYDSETQQRVVITNAVNVKQADNSVEIWHR